MESNPEPARPSAEASRFLVRLARAMHQYGTPVHQIEEGLELLARRLGIPAQFSAAPTSIIFSFGGLAEERTHLLRLEPGENDLGRLVRTADVARQVAHGELSPEAGTAALDAIASGPSRYGPLLSIAAFGLASAASARFLGGSLREVAAGGFIGLLLGVLATQAARQEWVRRLFLPLAATVAAILAAVLEHVAGPLALSIVTVAGIIILVPGLMVTTAITELANRHLVAGTARLAGAFVQFVILAFGVALGTRIVAVLLGVPVREPLAPSPFGWPDYAALLVAPVALTILLRAPLKDAPSILLTCLLGYAGSRYGAASLGPGLGVFLGSLTVGLAGTAYAALRHRPTAVVRVPGILLLVPGSIGFAGVTALMENRMASGMETLIRMVLIAVALSAGLLVASVVRPARIVD
jgi:uncharacterized membrane protein YjjP (DUF1212 family)